MEQQKDIFIRIIFASARNVIGFGLATAAIAYLASFEGLKRVALIFGVIEVFIIFVTLSALLYFIYYTINSYSDTRSNKPEQSFVEIYGYTISALAVRLLEAAVYVYITVFLYNIFLS